MKLYYDMLIPFMPEKRVDSETGEYVEDPKLITLKSALISLADYQISLDPLYLYQSIIRACDYCDIAMVDAVNRALENDIAEGDRVDDAALMIFNNLKQDAIPFDIYTFVSLLLTSAHTRLDVIRGNVQNAPNSTLPTDFLPLDGVSET